MGSGSGKHIKFRDRHPIKQRDRAHTLTAASWDLAPHTAAKLDILGAYLRAWFPILSRGRNFDRIIYIDGFAGPGRYNQGEDGSPIVALKAALGAMDGPVKLPFEFHFV
jgi:hypothetical protein